MKKSFILVLIFTGILVLILIIVMIGKGKNEEVADISFKLIEVKDRENTLKREESRFPGWGEDLKSEGKFIEVKIEAQNLGKEATSKWLLGNIIDGKGRKFNPIAPMKIWEWYPENNQCFEELSPGSPGKFCTIIYEVAVDSQNLKVEVWALGQEKTMSLGI